jgi:catechol 2,3-dioxygenase-like lactoylglutathione lyase family enzyme
VTAASSLGVAILGTASLDAFVDFYGGQLGMEPSAVVRLEGPAFERHWNLAAGSQARAVLLSVAGSPVGRVLGLEFEAGPVAAISAGIRGPFIGYWNLNFYVDDIEESCRRLAARGFRFWSRPVRHTVGESAGAPIEAIFEGPDGVAINLVQLDAAPGSPIEAIWRETRAIARSPRGFSQVATSAHATSDLDAAARFYREVLGMHAAVDAVLESAAVNELTGRPRDARTRVLWMRGDHPYGKVALSQPLNYTLPDRAAAAAAPATGYLAQGFAVPDLAAALVEAQACGAPLVGAPVELALPGAGAPRCALLRVPGSGALVQLLEIGE